jgi:hypothetical protein
VGVVAHDGRLARNAVAVLVVGIGIGKDVGGMDLLDEARGRSSAA